MIVSWFSAGVSSAVATKLALNKYGDVKIIYTHIEDQHPDTMRFIKDCEEWFGVPVEITQSELKSVENAVRKTRFINSPHGAACTRLLKIRVRQIWEMDKSDLTYVWGYDMTEKRRADRVRYESMPEFNHIFPLMENNIDKRAAHGMLKASGIKRPAMYDLGFPNNNCIGCLKASGGGYWRKIKQEFPSVYENRCKLERMVNHTINKEYFLDEMPEHYGRDMKIIVPDCGLFCEIDDATN